MKPLVYLIIGPAVRKNTPTRSTNRQRNYITTWTIKTRKVCGTGKFCDATGFEALYTPNFLAAIVNNCSSVTKIY
jgi:hypothetical protein